MKNNNVNDLNNITKEKSVELFMRALITPLVAVIISVIYGTSGDFDDFSFAVMGIILFAGPFLMVIREYFFNKKLLISLYPDYFKGKIQSSNSMVKSSFIILFVSQLTGIISIFISSVLRC